MEMDMQDPADMCSDMRKVNLPSRKRGWRNRADIARFENTFDVS